jgi:hypothetical protein
MKQGETRRLKPKPKKDKKSWQKRNEARKAKQESYQAPVFVESGVETPITQENS